MVQDFDLGYLEGSTQVSVRTSNNLSEMWNDFSQGKKVILWCDGLKEQEKRMSEFDEYSAHPSKKRKSKHVEDSVAEETVHMLK